MVVINWVVVVATGATVVAAVVGACVVAVVTVVTGVVVAIVAVVAAVVVVIGTVVAAAVVPCVVVVAAVVACVVAAAPVVVSAVVVSVVVGAAVVTVVGAPVVTGADVVVVSTVVDTVVVVRTGVKHAKMAALMSKSLSTFVVVNGTILIAEMLKIWLKVSTLFSGVPLNGENAPPADWTSTLNLSTLPPNDPPTRTFCTSMFWFPFGVKVTMSDGF